MASKSTKTIERAVKPGGPPVKAPPLMDALPDNSASGVNSESTIETAIPSHKPVIELAYEALCRVLIETGEWTTDQTPSWEQLSPVARQLFEESAASVAAGNEPAGLFQQSYFELAHSPAVTEVNAS